MGHRDRVIGCGSLVSPHGRELQPSQSSLTAAPLCCAQVKVQDSDGSIDDDSDSASRRLLKAPRKALRRRLDEDSDSDSVGTDTVDDAIDGVDRWLITQQTFTTDANNAIPWTLS